MAGTTTGVVGRFVFQPSAPGIARVGAVDVGEIRFDFFESAAEPIAESVRSPIAEVRHVRLSAQARLFFQDEDAHWHAGQAVGGGPDVYFVRLPTWDFDLRISEDRLRVCWERTPADPLHVLLTGANETPRLRDARVPVRHLILSERAAIASATGVASSGVRLHAHQLSAALRVIRDPVQRYLLADEVGWARQIQAAS